MDLSKLSDDQLQIAMKVADEAKRQGVNPDFVLPMVMVESGFKQDQVSKKGAIGVMQLMPDTARLLNVDPNDLNQNISGGVAFIKQLMQNKNIGNDPYKILTGYNAGPAARFFETGNIQDLPDETLNHMLKVTDAYGKSLPSVSTPETVGVVPALPAEGKPLIPPSGAAAPGTTEPPSAQIPVPVAAAAGAILGAPAGVAAAQSKAKYDVAREAYDLAMSRLHPSAAPAAAVPEAAPTYGGEKWVKGLTNVNIPGGQMSKADLDLAKGMQAAVGRAGEPGFTGGKITPGGVIITPQTAAAIEKSAEAAAPAAQTFSKSHPFFSYAGKLFSMPVKGALYGAGTAAALADMYNRRKTPSEAAVAGLGALSGAVAPFVSSMGGLPAAAVAAPLYLAASDRLKHLQKHPEDYRVEEAQFDPLGMPLR